MCAPVKATLTLTGRSAASLRDRAELLDMEPKDYVALCLNVCEGLPIQMMFCLAQGVRVTFTATAEILGEVPEDEPELGGRGWNPDSEC